MGRAEIAVVSPLYTKEEIFFHKYDCHHGMLFARKVNIIYLMPTFARTITDLKMVSKSSFEKR